MTPQPCTFCVRWQEQPEFRIAEFEQSYLVLNPDQFFSGYCFLYAKQHVAELFQLEQTARSAMMEEISRSAQALQRVFSAHKINYELLGNMVPHIHWHLVPRFTSDPLWPRPIWSEPHQELLLTPEAYRQRIAAIRQELR